jgi:hypothetical protein
MMWFTLVMSPVGGTGSGVLDDVPTEEQPVSRTTAQSRIARVVLGIVGA